MSKGDSEVQGLPNTVEPELGWKVLGLRGTEGSGETVQTTQNLALCWVECKFGGRSAEENLPSEAEQGSIFSSSCQQC